MVYFLYDVLQMLPMAVWCMLLMDQYLIGNSVGISDVVAVVIFVLYLAVLKAVRKKQKAVLVVVSVVSLCLLIILMWRLELLQDVRSYVYIGIAFLCALLSVLLALFMRKYKLLRLVVVGMVIAFLVVGLCLEWDMNRWEIGTVALICLWNLCILVQMRWIKYGAVDHKRHMIGITPFVLVGIILALLLPTSEKPYDWAFAIKIWNGMKLNCMKLSQNILQGNSEGYQAGYTGFTESGKMLSSIKNPKKDKVVMTYTPYAGFMPYVYLDGMTYDTFDGEGWSQTISDTHNEMRIDAADVICSVEQYTDCPQDYMVASRGRIEYKDMKSAHIFCPAKSVELRSETKYFDCNWQNGCPMFDRKHGFGMAYGLTFIKFNEGNEAFGEYANSVHDYSENAFAKTMEIPTRYGNFSTITYQDVMEQRQRIYDAYLPEITLSGEVETYVEQMTEGAESDLEKLLRIKEELMTYTYSYSIEDYPSEMTDASKYLDYFLLQERKGFCMHYATAMVLLARAEGIPARYVQGYYVRCNGNQTVEVHSSDAHAWAQVYLDGIGWLDLDATPYYGDQPLQQWELTKKEEHESVHSTYEWTPKEENSEVLLEVPEEENHRDRKLYGVILVSVGFGVLFLAGVMVVSKLLSKRKIKNLDERQQVICSCQDLFKLLRMMGFVIRDGETLWEFRQRAECELGDGAMDFVEILENVLYASDTTLDMENDQILVSKIRLLEILKERRGEIYYWWGKLLYR